MKIINLRTTGFDTGLKLLTMKAYTQRVNIWNDCHDNFRGGCKNKLSKPVPNGVEMTVGENRENKGEYIDINYYCTPTKENITKLVELYNAHNCTTHGIKYGRRRVKQENLELVLIELLEKEKVF